jgi:hypothetical protein
VNEGLKSTEELFVFLSVLDDVYRVTEFYNLGEKKPPADIGHLKKNRTNILIMEEHVGLSKYTQKNPSNRKLINDCICSALRSNSY